MLSAGGSDRLGVNAARKEGPRSRAVDTGSVF